MSFDQQVPELQARVEAALERRLPREDAGRLEQAMRYAALGGGKRVRPLLVYATGEVLGVDPDRLDGPACAVELIHAYSLVHDDLPAMDDDDLRRGRATCHRAFDEATAILAGDALQVLAFDILAADLDMAGDPGRRLSMIRHLARAAGAQGMAGGQALDLAASGQDLDRAALERIHSLKTGALIQASVSLGRLSAGDLPREITDALNRYGERVGLAFQIHDDVLDVEGETEVLGKPRGSDQARNQPTFPSVLGLEAAKALAREAHGEAIEALAPLGKDAAPLRWLADYIVGRAH